MATSGINFEERLLMHAREKAKKERRSLSNYINLLIERDIADGDENEGVAESKEVVYDKE